MIATQNESFPLPDFEDRLWSELEQLHAEVAVDGGSSPTGPNRRRRYLTVVGGLAAAASIAALLLVVDDDGRTNTAEDGEVPAAENTAPPPTDPVEDPASQAAIVVKEFGAADGTVSTTWMDSATGTSRMVSLEGDGSIGWEDGTVFTTHPDGTRTSQQTAIDHVTREYQVFPPSPLDDEFAPGWEAREILDGVEIGDYVLDGTDVIDGVEVRRYVAAGMAEPPPGITPEQLAEFNRQAGTRIVWIDPVAGRLVKDQSAGGSYDYTQTYTYLPRTPENLASLDFAIPQGYREVTELSRGLG